jgi:cupin 2 domain-containing protein
VKTVDNLFENIPDRFETEVFENLLSDTSVTLERILSNGQATQVGEWYDQDRNEWVVLLQGQAALLFEGESEEILMKPGDYILIPAHKRHRVEWTSSEETTVWLALHYAASA